MTTMNRRPRAFRHDPRNNNDDHGTVELTPSLTRLANREYRYLRSEGIRPITARGTVLRIIDGTRWRIDHDRTRTTP